MEARLAKAASLPLPKIAKIQIVRHAFAMAFHACEISLPSQTRLLSMRRSVASFILPRKGSANPWLACAIGAGCHLDPLYRTATQVFRMLRHACFRDPETFARVWNRAIYLKQPQLLRLRESAQGPAATLARLTDHLQWTLLPNRAMCCEEECPIPYLLLQGSILETCLEATWTALIHGHISGTKRWGAVPAIDFYETRRCIRGCDFIDCKLVLTHLTGSLRTTDMKSHWLPNEELLCPLCQGPLDEDHIVCHCPMLQATRQPWEEFLHGLPLRRKYLVHSPFCAALPESCKVRAGLLSEPVSLGASQLVSLEEDHVFFTDGSASSAFHGLDAVAAWAICGIPRETASLWVQQNTSALPEPHFQWSCSGRVPGLQTNNRAELCAIALVIANTTRAEIVTDS